MKLRKLATTLFIGTLSILSLTNNTAHAVDEEPTNTTETSITFESGGLMFGVISPTLNFEKSIINESEEGTRLYKTQTDNPVIQVIQVIDNRGTGAGWHVTAQLEKFTSPSNEEDSLPGATLTLDAGTSKALPGNQSGGPKVTDNIELVAGAESAVKVVNATDKAGKGLWNTQWLNNSESENITLDVPAGAATVDENTANITWTLIDGPSTPDL